VRFKDPYDNMSDEEFEAQFLRLLEKEKSVAVSFRFPRGLLERTKSAAEALEVPYQTLVKSIVEAGIERLERRSSASRAVLQRARADSDLTAASAKSGARRRTKKGAEAPSSERRRTKTNTRGRSKLPL
jgi:predicted DNA binding CopG/RHH family protein